MILSQSMFHTKLSTLKNTTQALYLHSYILLVTAGEKSFLAGNEKRNYFITRPLG